PGIPNEKWRRADGCSQQYNGFPPFPQALQGHPGASNSRLEQVNPDSAFWSSPISIGVTLNPFSSMRPFVSGNEAGKTTVSPMASALPACGSAGSTSTQSKPARRDH